MTTTQTIRERLAAPFAAPDVRVNRAGGYIDNVLICGTSSRNGRDYPAEVLKRDHAKYEGAPVNADHKDAPGVGDRVGWFSHVRPGSDGRPRGRLNVLKAHPLAEQIFEAAERRPQLFGMSHVAVCSTARRNGREVVESINKVISIDIVADPATTAGLYESTMRRVREESGVTMPAGSVVLTAAAAEKLKGLVGQLEEGLVSLDDFEKFVAVVIADVRRAAEVGADVPAGESVRVPADGKAFAEFVGAKPKAPSWYRQRKFLERIGAKPKRPTTAGPVPTDGKAFAKFIGGGK